jgi:hypothetical protein
MRFAVAATILANTLPATLRPNGVLVEAREEKRQLWRALLHAPASDRPQAAKQAIAARRRKLGNGGMLKNLASPRVPPSAECNPDVGVLACGFGEYCNGSMESSLGGVCVPLASEFRRGLDQGMYGSAAPTDSPLDSYINVNATGSPTASPTGTNGTYTDTTGGPGVYCDPDSPFYGDLECNCEDWVSENNTGALECTLFNETCYTGCEDTCYSIDFSYNTDGSAISYQYCYDFVSPFEQTFCFGFSSDQSCLISLDGTTCSSCYTSYRLNCDNGSCDSESCSNFNCSNLDLGTGNSCYDSVVPPAFYDCYLYLNDQYPSCSICPDDNIAYPETYFDLPGYGSFNCSYIGDLASYGTLNPQQCTYATALAANACCEGAEGPVYICNICTEEDHIVTNGKLSASNEHGGPDVCQYLLTPFPSHLPQWML